MHRCLQIWAQDMDYVTVRIRKDLMSSTPKNHLTLIAEWSHHLLGCLSFQTHLLGRGKTH
jgi:hypothetical protein